MVIEKQVTWLDDYKKEVKTLMYELDNLDQKQLRALSLKLKNNFKKVIEDSDYKIPDDYFGVAKSILSEDKNIKDEYKDEFWGFVLSRTLAGKSGEKMHYAIHIPDDDWKRWHVNQSEMEYDNFNDFISSWDSMDLFYEFDDDYKSGDKQHLVALFDESSHRSQDGILTPKLPADLKAIIFKAIIYEFVFPEQAGKVWDELVSNQYFTNYLKTFSQKNIKNNLTTKDDYDFLDQIDNGYIPMMKELPVAELRRKYKDNI